MRVVLYHVMLFLYSSVGVTQYWALCIRLLITSLLLSCQSRLDRIIDRPHQDNDYANLLPDDEFPSTTRVCSMPFKS
jgi:hypothetical protein